MSDTKDTRDKTRTDGAPPAGGSRTLTLNPRGAAGGAGTVRQSFSHGRTKAVVVEKKRARVMPGGGTAPAPEKHERVEEAPRAAAAPQATPAQPSRPQGRSGVVLRTLTEDE
jgi:translation initiation factor IF-2